MGSHIRLTQFAILPDTPIRALGNAKLGAQNSPVLKKLFLHPFFISIGHDNSIALSLSRYYLRFLAMTLCLLALVIFVLMSM